MHNARKWAWSVLAVLWVCGFSARIAAEMPGSEKYFTIEVVDSETGRGVPLVEMKTVSDVPYVTDSSGLVAFYEPGLMDREVFFHMRSHGYDFPRHFFGDPGMNLITESGGIRRVEARRRNIAERLYRITGEGIYRDSVLLGRPVPLRNPLLNADVAGQDTVIATPYRDKIYWFWGDTDWIGGPLGNLQASGATSEWPGQGGLDQSVGIDLTYFLDEKGFSKSMCPDMGPGLVWIGWLATVPDATGRERLVAHVTRLEGIDRLSEIAFMIFDDEKEIFERYRTWDVSPDIAHVSTHPFVGKTGETEFYYLTSDFRFERAPAELESLADPESYEVFTCLAPGEPDDAPRVERDEEGKPVFGWKKGVRALTARTLRRMVSRGDLPSEVLWYGLRDPDSGQTTDAAPGSIFWNPYRQRWVMIASSWGDIWYAEADTVVGPWVYARRVLEHDKYHFYNPAQHPFFDQEGGRLIYFEGTYTDTWIQDSVRTPRYDYNQIMYRLALDDGRLHLPAPVYRLSGSPHFAMRDTMEELEAWDRVESIPFFALAPDRRRDGSVAVYASEDGILALEAVGNAEPLFYGLPLDKPDGEGSEDLFALPADAEKDGEPIARVWRNPLEHLVLDPHTRPVPGKGSARSE